MESTLLIFAAGLASRYGSLKQIDIIGPSNERIIDYSVYDAAKAGFSKIVYVIRKSFEEEFKEEILNRLPKEIEADYVCQELDMVPKDIQYSKERNKPWGTGHALLSAAEKIKTPFAVVNADDFYGAESYRLAFSYIKNIDSGANEYALIGFRLKNTLSDKGSVSRAICGVDANGIITSMVERTKIITNDNIIRYDDGNGNWLPLQGDEVVSMNFFVFTPNVFKNLEQYFAEFVKVNGSNIKAEFELPTALNKMIAEKKAKLHVLETKEKWFGLTYKEDKAVAKEKINSLIEKKIYPVKLWN